MWYFPTHAVPSPVHECQQKTADPDGSVFQKQKTPDMRQKYFTNSYYKLNIFIEHKYLQNTVIYKDYYS